MLGTEQRWEAKVEPREEARAARRQRGPEADTGWLHADLP